MSNSNSLELAKKGHPQAIAHLINQQLKVKGITAKVVRKTSSRAHPEVRGEMKKRGKGHQSDD